jgi:hypothetical protein
MSPQELAEAGRQLYGKWGWQTRLSEALNVDGSTVRRWVSGALPVPGPAEAAIRCFLREQASRDRS